MTHFLVRNRRLSFSTLCALITLLQLPAAESTDFLREQVLALGKLTTAPVMQPAADIIGDDELQAIFFDALPWKGKPTKVFAWLGTPKIPAKTNSGKTPGMVLVHGGGGTADKKWVKKWTDKGYAAISIAVEGQLDVREDQNAKKWKKHEWAGPSRNGIYGDSDEPLVDQWMYHTIADMVLAHSLLRSQPNIDINKIGVMGYSWGGVITSTVIGIDMRFAFAISVYGCGHLAQSANQYGAALGKNLLYQEVWDPLIRMNRVQIPVLWLSWPEDQHFPLDSVSATYRAASGPHLLSLIPKMGHGGGPSNAVPDSYAFADSIVQDGKPWCLQVSQVRNDNIVEVDFSSTKPLERAVLISTTDTGFTGKRKWIESPAMLSKSSELWHLSATLPTGTTAWFINAHSQGLTVSSDYQEITP
jgi:dienelactone hydrolase